jgi:hypothetical protein
MQQPAGMQAGRRTLITLLLCPCVQAGVNSIREIPAVLSEIPAIRQSSTTTAAEIERPDELVDSTFSPHKYKYQPFTSLAFALPPFFHSRKS